MARRHNAGCGTVVLGAFLVALVPASFATPGMWWVGVILIAVGLLALSGWVSAQRRPRATRVVGVTAPRPVTRYVPRIFYRARCLHCGAPRSHNAAACRYCGSDLTVASG